MGKADSSTSLPNINLAGFQERMLLEAELTLASELRNFSSGRHVSSRREVKPLRLFGFDLGLMVRPERFELPTY